MTYRRWLLIPALLLASCGPNDASGPPTVYIDDSTCDHCGMIISDERFASATIVEGARGPEVRLFDDFNCQLEYEASQPGLVVEGRWVHDHDTTEWLKAADAWFLSSPELRTPMGSHIAAFDSEKAARDAQERLGGTSFRLEDLESHISTK